MNKDGIVFTVHPNDIQRLGLLNQETNIHMPFNRILLRFYEQDEKQDEKNICVQS